MLRKVGDVGIEGAETLAAPVIQVDKLGNVVTGGSGSASASSGAAYLSPGDLDAAWASATTLDLSGLPFPPLFEQFVGVAEYDGDNLIASYSVDDPAYDFTWTPGADSSTGVLAVDTATFVTGHTFVVQIAGPERAFLDVLSDFAGLDTHHSQRDFAAVHASGTTLAITGMAMDPDIDDIWAVVEIAAGGRSRMTYTRDGYAFTWAAGAAGTGTLTIAGATLQAGSTFIVMIKGPEHGTARADAGPGVSTRVKYTQPVDSQGNVITGGGGTSGGLTLYSNPYHFTVTRFSDTQLDLSGDVVALISKFHQFVEIDAYSAAGAYEGTYKPKSHDFSWDAANNRVTVTGVVFAVGGDWDVKVLAADRTVNLPASAQNVLVGNQYQLNSDDSAVDLITAAQDFTAGRVDVGSEISTVGYKEVKFYLTIDINDSTDLQFNILEKHESGGTEEYQTTIETPGASDVPFEPGYWELAVDADALLTLTYHTSGATPFIQLQIKAGALGAGTDAQLDAASYVRSTF